MHSSAVDREPVTADNIYRKGGFMLKFGNWVAKHRIIILIIGVLLMIPAAFGYLNTRVNYDLLS